MGLRRGALTGRLRGMKTPRGRKAPEDGGEEDFPLKGPSCEGFVAPYVWREPVTHSAEARSCLSRGEDHRKTICQGPEGPKKWACVFRSHHWGLGTTVQDRSAYLARNVQRRREKTGFRPAVPPIGGGADTFLGRSYMV